MRARVTLGDRTGRPMHFAPIRTDCTEALVDAIEVRTKDIEIGGGTRSSKPWPYGSQIRALLKMQGPVKQLGEKRPSSTRPNE